MLLGLTGKKLAGKDTAFRVLRDLYGGTRVRRIAFADKLYASAAAALGVTVDELNEWKTNPQIEIQIRDFSQPGGLVRQSLTVREYLQLYGTEAHRDIFGDNFWVDQLDLEMIAHDNGNGDDIVVITDVRFENEARRVLERGGQVLRIVGPDEVETAGDGHASEAGLPATLVDAYVSNRSRDGDFSFLMKQLEEIVTDIEEGKF